MNDWISLLAAEGYALLSLSVVRCSPTDFLLSYRRFLAVAVWLQNAERTPTGALTAAASVTYARDVAFALQQLRHESTTYGTSPVFAKVEAVTIVWVYQYGTVASESHMAACFGTFAGRQQSCPDCRRRVVRCPAGIPKRRCVVCTAAYLCWFV